MVLHQGMVQDRKGVRFATYSLTGKACGVLVVDTNCTQNHENNNTRKNSKQFKILFYDIVMPNMVIGDFYTL